MGIGSKLKRRNCAGIDNLPNEVAHLLNEIKHKDTRAQGVRYFPPPCYLFTNLLHPSELQAEIDKESSRYIRHSLRLSAAASSTPGTPSGVPPSPSSKMISIPARISAAYAEIQNLATEKEELAVRLVSLIERTRTRLDCELTKVRTLSGETTDYTTIISKPLVGLEGIGGSGVKTPVLAVTESLKNALVGTPLEGMKQGAASVTLPVSPGIGVGGGSAHKREFDWSLL